MTEADFRGRLRSVLDAHTSEAVERLGAIIDRIPLKAKELEICVFPSQDGDGFFSVDASFSGPDLYILNTSIRDVGAIFDARYTEDGVEPDIPLVSPSFAPFAVNDVIVDCVAAWIQDLWTSMEPLKCRVPVYVVGHDDFGTITPIELTNGGGA